MSSSMRSQLAANTAAALSPILSVAKSISNLLVVQFLLGMLMGFPASHIPTLQDTVFGSRAFAIVGAFGGVKGVLSIVTGPALGYYSDTVGRREALMISLLLSTLPSVWVAVFDLFWGYYVTDAFVGVYSSAMSIVMACVSDTLQIYHESAGEVLVNSGEGLAKSRQEVDEFGNRKILEGEVVSIGSNGIEDSSSTNAASSSSLSSPNPRIRNENNNNNNVVIQGNLDSTTASASATAEELVRRTRAMSIAMAAMALGAISGAGFGTVLDYQNAYRCSMFCGILSVCLVHWPMRVFLDRLTVLSQLAPEERPKATHATTTTNQNENPNQNNNRENQAPNATSENDDFENEHYQVTHDDHENHHHHKTKKIEKASLLSENATSSSSSQNKEQQQQNPYLHSIHRSVARSQKTLKTYTGLRQLAVIVFCDSLVIQAMAILIPLYMKKYLAFSPADQTVMMVILGLSSAIGLLLIVPFVTARVKTMGMLRLALIADMICVSFYAVVKSKPLAQILPLFTSVGVAMFPCASSLASEVMFGATSASEGLAQGIVSAARMFAEGVSPLFLGALLSVFEGSGHPGMPFLLVGLQELIALWLTVKLEAFMNLPSAWRYEEPSASPVMAH